MDYFCWFFSDSSQLSAFVYKLYKSKQKFRETMALQRSFSKLIKIHGLKGNFHPSWIQKGVNILLLIPELSTCTVLSQHRNPRDPISWASPNQKIPLPPKLENYDPDIRPGTFLW